MLLGLIFVTPLFGMAIGAAFGAMGGAFRDCGISDALVLRRALLTLIWPGVRATDRKHLGRDRNAVGELKRLTPASVHPGGDEPHVAVPASKGGYAQSAA